MHHSIEIDNLSFSYPDGHSALNHVSLHIQPCEKVALVGPNGAGKSTLILHLNGILTGKGDVVCCRSAGDQRKLGKSAGPGRAGLSKPDDQLFSPTVYDDVAFGPLYQGLPPDEVRDRVEGALAVVAYAGLRRACLSPSQHGREEAHRDRHRALDEAGSAGAG